MFRDDAVFHNALLVINVVDEQVEGLDPLLQPTLDVSPIRGLNHTWKNVEREDLLRPGLVAIYIESDAQLEHSLFCGSLVPE